MLLVGASPGPVEHVFTVRVVFGIDHTGCLQFPAAFQQKEMRRPSGVCHCAAALMQGREVSMLHERRGMRLRGEKRIPSWAAHLTRRLHDPDDIIRMRQRRSLQTECQVQRNR